MAVLQRVARWQAAHTGLSDPVVAALETAAEIFETPVDLVDLREGAVEEELATPILGVDRRAEFAVGVEGAALGEAHVSGCSMIAWEVGAADFVDLWDQCLVVRAADELRDLGIA